MNRSSSMAGVLTEEAHYYGLTLSSQAGGNGAIGTYLESKAPRVAHDPFVGAFAVMENIFHF